MDFHKNRFILIKAETLNPCAYMDTVRSVLIAPFHFRYNTDIAAFSVSRYGYQPDNNQNEFYILLFLCSAEC